MYKQYRLHCTSETVRELTCTCTYIHVHAPDKMNCILSVPKFYVFVFLYAEKLKEWGAGMSNVIFSSIIIF